MQAVAVLAGVALMAWMVPGGVPRWQRLRAVLLGLLLLALATWWFVDRLSGDGFNAATIYHLRSDMEGAGIADFRKPMLAYAGLLLASLILPLLLLRRRPAPTVTRGWSPLIFAGGLALALLASPLARDGLRLYRDMRPADGLAVAGDYVLPQHAPGKPLNIVWLYAESLERTYLDPVTFPGLLPNVATLASEGLDFRGLGSPQGSGWTIAGLVASQCGVPLTAAPGDENSLGRMAHFLPEARCLSDYLRDHGYHASFIGGADGTFAGKAGFLRDHGYAQVHDLADFRDMRLSRRDFSPWGVHDDVLLDHAWNEFQRLSQAGTPFLLSALTLDTHHPAGHLPVACRRRANDPGPQGRAGMLAALRCSDRLIGQFVQRIRNSPWADNTLLVVASDHLAMPNALSAELEALPRENLLLMFGAGLPPREVPVMAAGSTLDSGATVLALLGAGDQLGFGRSLLADVPGGPASRAAGEDSDGYRRYLAFANGLWTRGNPRRLQVEGDRLRVGAQEVRLPVLLDYDRNWQLAGMMLEDVPGRFRRSRPEHALAYVDRCTAFDDDAPEAGWCAMVVDAAQGARLYRSAELAEGVRVDAPRLAAADHRRDGLRQPVMLGRAIRDTGPGAYQVRVQAPRLPAHPFWIEAVTAQGQLLGQFRVEPGTGPDGRIHMPLWLAESVDDMQIRVWLSNLDELDDPGNVDVALVNDHDSASSS